jgi:TM2 domain-containing membrane protein YozV
MHMATSESVVAQAPRKSKLIAGLLGLCFGVLGIHWFYLGNKKRGLTQLILFIVGILLCIVLIGIPIMIGVEIWAFVDAIRIFTGSINKDSDGLPLKD